MPRHWSPTLFLLMCRSNGFQFIQRDRMKQLIPNSCGEINHIPHTFETFERQSNHDGRLFSTPGENTLQPQDPVEHPEPSPPHVRHQVRWETANGIIEFSALDGETLRTAALRRGVVSPHNGRAQLINCTFGHGHENCNRSLFLSIAPPVHFYIVSFSRSRSGNVRNMCRGVEERIGASRRTKYQRTTATVVPTTRWRQPAPIPATGLSSPSAK